MIADKALLGLALDDVFVFDVHGHLCSDAKICQPNDDGAGLVATMDQLGVNSICVSSGLAMESDEQRGNELTAKTAQEFAGRIYGYAVPNPHHDDCEIAHYFEEDTGMVGVKIHADIQGTSISDPRYLPYMELADKKGLPVLFHTWMDYEVREVCALAQKFKNAKMILGHAAMTGITAKKAAIETCKLCENVFVDTAMSSTYDGAIEWIVSKVGADRLLYGSDMPFFDCRQTFGKLALSKLSDSDKIKIFGENAKKIFNRVFK